MQQVLQDFVGKYKESVDRGIAEELEKRLAEVKEISPHLVKVLQAMKELSVGGKRLRGMLVILGYQIAAGGPAIKSRSDSSRVDEVIKAAVVMELFHLGLLIQDDFMDRDMTRRGVPTMIARYDDPHTGNFISMLAGDYTFGWGIEILSSLNLPTTNVNNSMRVWGKYFTRVGYGQTLDGLDIADDETILKILSIKSGEYSCVLPLLLGASLGGASKELLAKLEQYGMELGSVFQLRDDWLGMWGEQTKTGKPAGEQAKRGKKTYATMYGKEKTEEAIKEHMAAASDCLQGLSSQAQLMRSLVEWVGTRNN